MRPDFQCGICKQLVPEFYHGGCCASCRRIRCNHCMRQCPVCAAQLCPDCLDEARTDGGCMHTPVPPARPLVRDHVPPPAWRPLASALTSRRPPPASAASAPPAPTPRRHRHWPGRLAIVVAAMLFIPMYALLELMIAVWTPPLALALAATSGSENLPPWLMRGVLPVAWLLACAAVGGRADSGVPLLLPAATVLIALALERCCGFNDFAYGVDLPLAAAYAGLCLGGAFGALWSRSCAWPRAVGGMLLGLLPLAFAHGSIDDVAGLAFVATQLLLLLLLPQLSGRRGPVGQAGEID